MNLKTVRTLGPVALAVLMVPLALSAVEVKFELLMGPDGQPVGYKFSESLATLKPGDTIALTVGMSFQTITVKSIERAGDRLVIDLQKELVLDTGTKSRLEYKLVDGYWIETDVLNKLSPPPPAPGASAPTKKPPAASPVAPAPAKEGPVRVSAEAILNAQEEVVGYKYPESLAAAAPGDTIPLFIRGLQEGPSSGTFKHLTVTAIERTGNRLRIDFEEELTLANGEKLNSMRFTLRQGYWFVSPARQAAPKKP